MGRFRGGTPVLGTKDRGLVRLILLIVLIVLVVAIAGVWAGGNAYAARWIATHGVTSPEGPQPPGSQDVVYSPGLHAWFTPPTVAGKATIVIAHGYQADRSHHAAEAAALRTLGYGTLQIDFGYVGGKKPYGGGGREATEVSEAVSFAKSHTTNGPVGLLGFSAGGSAAVLAAAHGAPVVAVVADSSPVGFIRLATDRAKIPRWLVALTPTFYPHYSDGGHLVDLASEVGKTSPYTVPTLIIQGSADKTVDPSNGPALAKLTKGQLWSVPEAEHTEAYSLQPNEYSRRLAALFGG
jgi:alpha-beta hydrolase superfamily lysophospholipase